MGARERTGEQKKRQQPGGAGGDRTRDLLTASQGRSQLRYSPKHSGCCRSPQNDRYLLFVAFFRMAFLAVFFAGLRMVFFVAFFLFIAKADPPPSCHCKG